MTEIQREIPSDDTSRIETLDTLRVIFQDKPDLLRAVTLGDFEGQGVLNEVRSKDRLFGNPVYQFTVGRTKAGKTTLGNLLFGAQAMEVTGRDDCTDYVGMLPMRSDLYYFDTPGAGGKEHYENYARLALGLEQIEDEEGTNRFELRDYGAATTVGGETVGVRKQVITADTWEAEFAEKFPPDVLVYVVAPQGQFIRTDRAYLKDILHRYGDKVVMALNWFDGKTERVDIENVRTQIERVYQQIFEGSVRPRFVEFNARTGAGIHDLTRVLCQVIAPEKLGGIQAVLDGELKEHARVQRSLHYRRTMHRIAARLALNTVDQQAGSQDLVSVAAGGLSQFGVLTFEAEASAAAFRKDLAALVHREADQVREKQSEVITTQDVETQQRDIVTREPVFDFQESTHTEKHKITRKVEDVRAKKASEQLGILVDTAAEALVSWVSRGPAAERKAMWERAREDSLDRTERVVEEEVDIPVKKIRQKVVDYQEKVIAKVNEVVGVTERVIGTKSLEGGVPVIELLLSVGTGVEAYCVAEGERERVDRYVERERQRVALALNRAKPQLAQLLKQGHDAEEEIAELLDGLFARS